MKRKLVWCLQELFTLIRTTCSSQVPIKKSMSWTNAISWYIYGLIMFCCTFVLFFTSQFNKRLHTYDWTLIHSFKIFLACLLISNLHRFPLNFSHLLICNLVSHVLCFKIMSFTIVYNVATNIRKLFHATNRSNYYRVWVWEMSFSTV